MLFVLLDTTTSAFTLAKSLLLVLVQHIALSGFVLVTWLLVAFDGVSAVVSSFFILRSHYPTIAVNPYVDSIALRGFPIEKIYLQTLCFQFLVDPNLGKHMMLSSSICLLLNPRDMHKYPSIFNFISHLK